jgi:hypothetical protein
MEHNDGVARGTRTDFAGFVRIGPRPFLDRIAAEYRLTATELRDKVRSRAGRSRIGDEVFDREFLVHASLLRSHGGFSCAGDSEALRFCHEIADAMVAAFGVSGDEAVARINRHWSGIWIVGLDLAYHETAERWAERIYQLQSEASGHSS